MNLKLKELYENHWDNLLRESNKIIDITPTNPLLLKVNEEKYNNSDIKVMIFGQETWGWHKFGTSIEEGMDRYYNFFIEEQFYKGYGKSAFWKGFNYFKKEINTIFKDKEITYIWNNISKIGRNDGKTGVTTKIKNLERQSFNVIKQELEILKPDIIIFFIGNRTNDLKFHFSDISFKEIEFNNKKVSKRKYKPASYVISKYLPKQSFKLYHPAYFGGFNYIKNDILKEISHNREV